MESPKCRCCERKIADGGLCDDCERALDDAAEAEWYQRVMRQYDATRRESGYRPGQE